MHIVHSKELQVVQGTKAHLAENCGGRPASIQPQSRVRVSELNSHVNDKL